MQEANIQQQEIKELKGQLTAAEEKLSQEQQLLQEANIQQQEIEDLKGQLAAAEEKLSQEQQLVQEASEQQQQKLQDLRKKLKQLEQQDSEQLKSMLAAAEVQLSQKQLVEDELRKELANIKQLADESTTVVKLREMEQGVTQVVVAQLLVTLNMLEKTFAYGDDRNRTLCGDMGEATMMMDNTTHGSPTHNGDSNNTTLGAGVGDLVVSVEFVKEIKSQLVALQSQLASLNDDEQTKQMVRQLQHGKQRVVAQLSATDMTDIVGTNDNGGDDEQCQVVGEPAHMNRHHVQILNTKIREEMNFQLPALDVRLRVEAGDRASELQVANEQHGCEVVEQTARYVRSDFPSFGAGAGIFGWSRSCQFGPGSNLNICLITHAYHMELNLVWCLF